MGTKILEIKGVEKSFGHNQVLRGIHFHIHAGEVIALMGANGAGKSTLVNILSGYHKADRGQMRLDNAPYTPRDPAEAIRQGIITVHQSINDGVIPDLDVASNLMLDKLASHHSGWWVSPKKLRQQARLVASKLGLDIDVTMRVADLSLADRQMISIARAMAQAPKVLILDEPTSSLSSSEAERLFTLIEQLRAHGAAIVYISHRTTDIKRLANRIVCLRDGQVAGVFDHPANDITAAVQAMLGSVISNVQRQPVHHGNPVIVIDQLRLKPGANPISLSVAEGEVVAITGLLGSGKSILAETLFGLQPTRSGEIRLDNQPYRPRSNRDALKHGIYMAVKDRTNNAVIPGFSITDNMTLPFLKAFSYSGFLNAYRQRSTTDAMIRQLGIVCQSNDDDIGTLSGGNQQKVMIGRWLLQPCRVLLLEEPFQGVDIGARRDISQHIRSSAQGRATLVFVSEVDEALEIADRIIVLHEGAIAGEHVNEAIDLPTLVAQMSGKMEKLIQ